MQKTLSKLLLITSVVMLACSKGEDAQPKYDFTVIAEQGYFTYDKDAWIILHDKNGTALAESQLLDGQTAKFTLKEKNVGVTIVKVNTNTENNLPSFQLETYLNVNAAATWTLRTNSAAQQNCGSRLGDVEVIVSDPDIANGLAGTFGTKSLLMLPDFSSTSNTSIRFSPLEVDAGCNNAFLYVMDKNRVPHYKFLENVNPGQYAYNLSQLNTFDQVIDINYKPSSGAIVGVTGFDANQSVYDHGYCTNLTLSDLFKSVTTSFVKVGYLNRFPKYVTSFSVAYPAYTIGYTEAGGIPSSITLPENLTATISDKTLAGYSFSVNETIVYRQLVFGYYPLSSVGDSGMTWTINAPAENDFKNLTILPNQFMTKYPEFKIENLKYESSSFYTESQTIDQIVAQKFGDATRPETYKSVYKTFRN